MYVMANFGYYAGVHFFLGNPPYVLQGDGVRGGHSGSTDYVSHISRFCYAHEGADQTVVALAGVWPLRLESCSPHLLVVLGFLYWF